MGSERPRGIYPCSVCEIAELGAVGACQHSKSDIDVSHDDAWIVVETA